MSDGFGGEEGGGGRGVQRGALAAAFETSLAAASLDAEVSYLLLLQGYLAHKKTPHTVAYAYGPTVALGGGRTSLAAATLDAEVSYFAKVVVGGLIGGGGFLWARYPCRTTDVTGAPISNRPPTKGPFPYGGSDHRSLP